MRKRLVSFCAVLLCGIFSVTFLVPAAAAFSNLDNIGIDPWGELDDLKNPDITDIPILPELSYPPDAEFFEGVEGGASTFSLNDDNATRYITVGGNILYGLSASSYQVVTTTTMIKTYEGATGYSIGSYQPETSRNVWLRAATSSSVTWEAPVSFEMQEGAVLSVSGTGNASLFVCGVVSGTYSPTATSHKAVVYPTGVQILVNGEAVGDVIEVVEGRFDIPSDFEIPLNQDITSLAYKFTFLPSGVTGTYTYPSNSVSVNRSCYFYIDDSPVFTYITEPTEPEYSGLLEGITGWLKNLWDAITGLPNAIVGGLLDGLSVLFVPTEEEITEMKDQYSTLLSERLGFIYQAYEWTISSAEEIVTTMEGQEEYSFTFPGISIPYQGQTLTIVPEQPVSMENAVMDVLRPVLGTIISLVSVAAFAHTAFDMVTALISGVSYFGFLKGKRGGNDE